jgi:serine kinase of HPr protein (carbohydrate metabolism regulator)
LVDCGHAAVTAPDRLFIQATCVVVEDVGVLLRGPPGSGKSDLALRLIDAGAKLVADDGVELRRQGDAVVARLPPAAPDSVRGRIEVRGVGIAPVPTVAEVRVVLVIDLVPADAVERLPEPASVELLGTKLPLLRLHGPEASAPAKVRLAVRVGAGHIIPPP